MYLFLDEVVDQVWQMKKSDGKIVECYRCGKRHVRERGEGNAIAPICRECDAALYHHFAAFIRRIKVE